MKTLLIFFLSACFAHEPVRENATPASVYDVAGEWVNASGEKIKLSKFKGKRAIFALFYSSCASICPMTVQSLKKVESGLGHIKDLQIILVSVDPERDKIEQLKNFAKTHAVKKSNWHLLSGSETQARNLAGVLTVGFSHRPASPELHQMHSLEITAVDQNGKLRGKTSSMKPSLETIRSLLESPPK